jgi:hypothetical protein
MLTHSELTTIFQYDPKTGFLYWNVPRPKIRVGAKAGYLHRKGYINLEINGKHYAAHRLVWFYVTGSMPTKQIDHINGDKSDNRFENLREASNGQNRANSKTTNKHGLKGVRRLPWMKDGDRCWQASIKHNKKVIYLGCYHTKEEAHAAYADAAARFHGDFAKP